MRSPSASWTGSAHSGPAPTRTVKTPSPGPEPAHATTALPTRLVPATRAEDSHEPHGAFEGRVVSATTGEGVEGAELTFAGPGGAVSAHRHASGWFRFVPSAAGTWQLAEVTARGYLPFGPEWGRSPLRFTAVPGQRISDLVLALTPEVELLARVEGPDGRPVAGALVSVASAASAWPRVYGDALGYETVTDAEGHFELEGLEPGSYDVTARLLGLALGELREVAVLTKRGPLRRDAFARLSFIDARGRYELAGMPPGSYAVQVAAHGHAPAEASVEVPEGALGEVTTDFSLGRGAKMTGRVVEEGSGMALERARIAVEGLGPGSALPVRYDALTDARGQFTLDGLPTGEVSLYVSAERHHGRILSGISVRLDATPPRVIELRKTEEGEEPQVELVGIGAVLAAREDALVLGVRKASESGTEGGPAPVVDITVTRRRIRRRPIHPQRKYLPRWARTPQKGLCVSYARQRDLNLRANPQGASVSQPTACLQHGPTDHYLGLAHRPQAGPVAAVDLPMDCG